MVIKEIKNEKDLEGVVKDDFLAICESFNLDSEGTVDTVMAGIFYERLSEDRFSVIMSIMGNSHPPIGRMVYGTGNGRVYNLFEETDYPFEKNSPEFERYLTLFKQFKSESEAQEQ